MGVFGSELDALFKFVNGLKANKCGPKSKIWLNEMCVKCTDDDKK